MSYTKTFLQVKKKTLILRALITEPEILILDEPCASLDIFQRKPFYQLWIK